jgi:hypothetical protein
MKCGVRSAECEVRSATCVRSAKCEVRRACEVRSGGEVPATVRTAAQHARVQRGVNGAHRIERRDTDEEAGEQSREAHRASKAAGDADSGQRGRRKSSRVA